jgi:hypothetical protein
MVPVSLSLNTVISKSLLLCLGSTLSAMMVLSNLNPRIIPGSLSQQMSVFDLFIPGFTNITNTASQALSGNWTGYTQLMCLFALAAFLKPYVLQLKYWFVDYCS